jgi:DNA-binding XRE family transcriptional regulator
MPQPNRPRLPGITRVDVRAAGPLPLPEVQLMVRHRGFRWPFRDGDGIEVWRGGDLAGILPMTLILELIQHRLTDRLLMARFAAVMQETASGPGPAIPPAAARALPARRRRAATPPGRGVFDDRLRRTRALVVGDRLRRTRARAGVLASTLAEQAGTSVGTILRLERGTSLPRGETIRRICDVLGISMDWLLTGRRPAGWPARQDD